MTEMNILEKLIDVFSEATSHPIDESWKNLNFEFEDLFLNCDVMDILYLEVLIGDKFEFNDYEIPDDAETVGDLVASIKKNHRTRRNH